MALLKFSFDRFSFEKSTREKLNTKQSIPSSQFLSNSFLSSNAFFGSFGPKEIIVESKMNSAMEDSYNLDQNYFQNTPTMNRISTQKNQGFKSTATQFLKKHFFGIVMVAFCSINTVFAQVPTITSFSPTSGAVGSTVTITGTNFDATASNNVVYFGSTQAVVNSASTTELSVSVPVSSTHSPISVSVNNLIAFSKTAFRTVNLPISTRPISGTWFGNNIALSSIAGVNGDVIVAAGDFNNDGKVDLVKGGSSAVRVHLNQMASSGTISTSSYDGGTLFSVNGGVISVQVGDINADGKLDIVTGSSNGVSILINTTSGATLSFANYYGLTSSGNSGTRIADLDGDGLLDIAAISGNVVKIYGNVSTPSTLSFTTATSISLSTGFNGLDLGDMNLDGKYDIVASVGGQTDILTNSSTSGSFSFSSPVTLAYGHSYVKIVDLDADGDNDLFLYTKVVNNAYSSGVLAASDFTNFTNSSGTDGDNMGMSAADFNGDGYPEIISGTTWDKMWVYINSGSGSPVSGSTISGSWYPRQDLYCGSCGTGIGVDVDGDNKVDAVSSYKTSANIVITQNLMTPPPLITETGNTLTSFTKCGSLDGLSQTFTVQGDYLSADITLTSSNSNYQFSTNGTTYSNSITFTRTGSTVSSTTVYVRIKSTATAGAQNGTITLASTGAVSRTISITGTAYALPTITGSGTVYVGGNPLQLTGSGTPDATTPWSSSDTNIATVDNSDLVTARTSGSFIITYLANTGCSITKSMTSISAVLTASTSSLSNFTSCANNPSVGQSFTVSGTNLSGNLVLTAPTGFEVSLSHSLCKNGR